MAENHDSNDEIHSISRRLQTVTTSDKSPIQQSTTRSGSHRTSPNVETKTPPSASASGFRDIKKCTMYGENGPVRSLPELNVPERIILIVDVAKEQNCTQFKLGTGATYMPMFMIKRVIEIFVGAKSMINRSHEYALMTLCSDSIKWLCDFTNSVKMLLNALDSLVEEPLPEDETSFDLSQLFEALDIHVNLPKNMDCNDPPPYVTRAILIYSRSNCVPGFHTGRKYFDILSDHPYFVLDALFVHEPPSPENKCEEVYEALTALDAKNFSYILEVGRNATKLHDNMAKLLAHSLQRPLQRNACYTVCIPGGTEEIHTNV